MVTFRNARNVAVGVTVGLAFVTAAPALAAPNPGINGSAFGASLDLLQRPVIGATPLVVLGPNGDLVEDETLSVPADPLVTVGVLNASTMGDPEAGTSTATGSVANVDVLPDPSGLGLLESAISADLVSATCDATPNGETGSVVLTNVQINGNDLVDSTPGPNTDVTVVGLASVRLNEQINNPDGSLTVNAIRVKLGNDGSVADLILGSATCGPNRTLASISALPTAGLPIAGGLVAAFALGVVVLRRRQMGPFAV
jgi:hypothetical protein